MSKTDTRVAKSCSVPTYAALRDKVRETLLDGMRRIEEARVRTYWQTGRYVQEHVLFLKEKADYGKRTVLRLSEELGIDKTELWRMLQFAERCPILGSCRLLTWSHCRVLITVPDEKKMLAFADRASKEGWTCDQLRKMIHSGKSLQPRRLGSIQLLEVPKLGLFNTYQIKAPAGVGWPATETLAGRPGKDVLLLDHGFRSFLALTASESRGLKAGDIVEVAGTGSPDKGGGACPPLRFSGLKKSNRTAKDLYTYKAYLEKVIDADTYWVALDTGLRGIGHQKLRLQGIDCPEINTPEGKAAKKFVEKLLKDVPCLTVLSHKNDKYDRYEADVFFNDKNGKQIYLNNLLLEKGRAVRLRS